MACARVRVESMYLLDRRELAALVVFILPVERGLSPQVM